jgi:integrase
MGRGDGRIYLRGQIYWVCYYLRGKQHRESTDTSDEKQATKFLKARLREVGADLLGARTFVTPKASRLTITELCGALKADFELRGKLSAQNASVFKRVAADFGEYRAVELSAEKIDKYIEQRLADGDAPATINRTTGALAQCYTLAIRRGHLASAPYVRHLSEAGNVRQGFLTEKELDMVISKLPEDLRDFVRWSALNGMRKGEAAGLTWEMVHGEELHVPGDICKNRRARVLPLAGELAKIIERRRQAARIEVNGTVRMVPFVFHRDGQPIREFRKSWATACVCAGVGAMVCPNCQASGSAHLCATCETKTKYVGKIFHDLRRVAVRRMVRASINPQIAKKWSGHISDSMLNRYSILTTDDMREAFETTEKFRDSEQQKESNVVAIGASR